MEYNNIENQLNKKLNQRAIEPSANAWLRIKDRKKIKRKVSYSWLYIAASLIVAFGIYWIYSPAPAERIIIVREASPVIPMPTPTIPPQIEQTPVIKYIVKEQPAVVLEEITIPETVKVPIPVIASSQEIVAVDEQKAIDYASAESLLRAAQQELATKKNIKLATSHTALLKEVESDVDKSFKERAIDMFHNKFKTIKIALKDD